MSTSNKGKKAQTEAEEIKDEELAEEEAAAAVEDAKQASEEKQPEVKESADKDSKAQSEEKTSSPVDELAVMNDRYLRLCAEYDNFRKRSQKEKDSLYGDVRADTVARFLPVYDNLVRALAQNTEDDAYRKGVEMIMNQFCSTLEKLGVTKTESLGQKFDPTLHNAVMHVDDEEKGENEIAEVFQEGFKLGDKVIRFAMVKVAN